MLLRRVTEHVKAQNWTPVALDFVRAIGFNHNVEPEALGSAFIQPTFQAASPNADTVLEAALVNPEYAAGLRVFFGLRSYNDSWCLRVHNETERVLAILEEEVKN